MNPSDQSQQHPDTLGGAVAQGSSSTSVLPAERFRGAESVLLLASVGFVISQLATPVQAKEGDTFRPFVSYTHYYDSNLYRLDDDTFPGVKRSDNYGVLSAGLNVDWQPGRQRILASASKSLVRFAHYENLDYDGSDYQLKWNWRLGNHWSGLVGATEKLTLSSFEDSLGLRKNELTREEQFANAEWQFHPRWSVGVHAANLTSTNSTIERAELDFEERSASANVGYTTPKGSKLRLQLRRAEGEYPNDPLSGSVTDREYTQDEINVLADWEMTGKLVTRARVGYTKRENEPSTGGDFSGLAGRVSADYIVSDKTMVTAAVYREVDSPNYVGASSQVNTGASAGVAWMMAPKTTLRANASYENRQINNDVPGSATRDDDVLSATVSVSYSPIRSTTVDVGLQAGQRESNVNGNDYSFHGVYVGIRADF